MSYRPMLEAPRDRKIMLFGRDDVFGWVAWEGRWEQSPSIFGKGDNNWTSHYHGRDEVKIEPEWWAEMPGPSGVVHAVDIVGERK